MKFLVFTFFLFIGSFNFLGAATTAPEVMHSETELASEILVHDLVVDLDEVCYEGSVTVTIGGVGGSVKIRACGDTAAQAWSDFLSAMRAPFE